MTAHMSPRRLRTLVAKGESKTLEIKRSTGELREALQSLCAFANGEGGKVVIGVKPDGKILGQQVGQQTLHELAAGRDRFEPPLPFDLERIKVAADREVLVLTVAGSSDTVPFTYDGRAFERVGNTTRKMSQARYESLLLDRAHSRRRWENQPAVDVRLEDLDREEILRTRDEAIRGRRISAGTGMDPGEVLDRLGLRRDGVLTQAAQMLYGTRFLPDYPQALLKMGRFRGTKITGDILDNRQEHLHAFAIAREGMAFLDRTLPLSARFPAGSLLREDRLPVPAEALREVLLNAVMHRDYSDPSGYVAIAVFDDRVEVRSVGRLPRGVTAESLSGPHRSVPRNPLMAEAFHRTGAVEIWGRGTNRVVDACKSHGIEPPTFVEEAGAVTVTFRATIAAEAVAPTAEVTAEATAEATAEVTAQVEKLLSVLKQPMGRGEIQEALGLKHAEHVRNAYLQPALRMGLVEPTIPDKPKSPLQKYRITAQGQAWLDAKKHSGGEP